MSAPVLCMWPSWRVAEMVWSIHKVLPHDSFFAAYCRMRIALWPDCGEEDCLSEALEITGSDQAAAFLALTETSKPVAFIELSLRSYAESAALSPVPFIEGWFVESAHRRQGAGRALVAAVEQWAVAQGFREIASDAQLENTVSIAAHLHLGYREVERIVCFLKKLQ